MRVHNHTTGADYELQEFPDAVAPGGARQALITLDAWAHSDDPYFLMMRVTVSHDHGRTWADEGAATFSARINPLTPPAWRGAVREGSRVRFAVGAKAPVDMRVRFTWL